MPKPMMKLGLSMRYLGYHDASWRHPEVPPGGASDFKYYLNSALIAERGLFDMVFFPDGLCVRAPDHPAGAAARNNRNVDLDPVTLLAALAPMTQHVGLVSTASTTYNEPYHVARRFASLDHISGGRAGWNIVTSWSDKEAWNFNRTEHLEYNTRYERAAEFVEVVTGLWDSWDDDAFLYDKQSGQFYDPEKLHVLDHRGPHFQVLGPLSSKRTKQGRPILVQAGMADQGQEIAASTCDLVYSAFADLPSAAKFYQGLKDRMEKYGRPRDALKVMPAMTTVVGRTRAEAQAKFDQMQALIDPLTGLSSLYRALGDLSAHDLDGPVPEPVNAPVKGIAYNTWEMAKREGLTIRQLYEKKAAGSSGLNITGTPADIADAMEEWFVGGGGDGFVVTPTHLPHGAADFVDLVVPELQRRELFRTEYEGTTLRENLGLPPNVSRYARSPARLESWQEA